MFYLVLHILMIGSFIAQNMQETPIITSNSMELDDDVNDINDTSRNVVFPTSCKLPFILQGEFFKVTTRSTDQKIIAQCRNCPKTISGSRSSTGNFVAHYNVSYTFFL